jgi:hypothetical protein
VLDVVGWTENSCSVSSVQAVCHFRSPPVVEYRRRHGQARTVVVVRVECEYNARLVVTALLCYPLHVVHIARVDPDQASKKPQAVKLPAHRLAASTTVKQHESAAAQQACASSQRYMALHGPRGQQRQHHHHCESDHVDAIQTAPQEQQQRQQQHEQQCQWAVWIQDKDCSPSCKSVRGVGQSGSVAIAALEVSRRGQPSRTSSWHATLLA